MYSVKKSKGINLQEATQTNKQTQVLKWMVFSGGFSVPHSVCSFTVGSWVAEGERWGLRVLFLVFLFLILKGFLEGCLATELWNCVSPSVWVSGCWESLLGNQHFILVLLQTSRHASAAVREGDGWLDPQSRTVILTFFLFRQRERAPQRKVNESPSGFSAFFIRR